MTRLFGTDGVRGVAGRELTGELAYGLGRAAVAVLGRHGARRPTFVLGRDTRASGEFLEAALAAGICSAGGDVLLAGVQPTPAVAYLTAETGASAGAVISASHNPPEDNGIKFFSRDGFKLPDALEDEIETLLQADPDRAEGLQVGRIRPLAEAAALYLSHLAAAAESRLEGIRVVVDCANGSASGPGPEILRRLGADVVPINDHPDGANINLHCGATQPDVVAGAVMDAGADAGVAFDGDADRAMFADAWGAVVDGDQVLAACAVAMHAADDLPGDTVVTTVLANLGFHRRMREAGIKVLTTKVGDRYVLGEMIRTGAVLGGEQSGHIIFRDHATTGDGLLTAVRFLGLCASAGRSVAEVAAMPRFPQVQENVPVANRESLDDAEGLWEAVRAAERALGDGGRVVVRASGTEPVVRVMVEAETEEEAARHAREIAREVQVHLG